MTKGKAMVPRDNGQMYALELPPHAIRYLQAMCERERTLLNNLSASGLYNVAIDAASDALAQIERALP